MNDEVKEKNIKGIDANLFGDSMMEKMHEYSPFIEKRLIYQTDNNPNKDYSLGQVEFDSTAAFEGSYTDWKNGYILIPQVLCVESATDINFDTHGFDYMLALKNSDMNLINSYEIELDNGSIVKKYDLTNMYVNFVLNTEMTEQEIKSEGKSFGYTKDGTGWMFNEAASIYGEGLCNNCNTDKASYQSTFADVEPNMGMLERQRIYKNNLKKGSDKLFSDAELTSKQYCRIENDTKAKIVYYNAVIPLKHLDFFKNMPISKGCNFKITFQMNQVYFEVTKAANGILSFVKNSYVNRGGNKTNPLMVAAVGMSAHAVDFEDINTVSVTALNDIYGTTLDFVPASVEFVNSITPCGSAGLPVATYKISNSIVTNNWTQQPQTEKKAHGLNNCRLYAETYVLHPDFSSIYLNTPTARVPFKNVITKNILNVLAGDVIDTTITNGIANPIRLIIVPILSANANGVGVPGGAGSNLYSPLISPFTTEPATCSPYSLSDFNIEIAGKPVFNGKELKYNHEHFKYELGNSSTLSYDEWINNYGYIVVDLKRRIKDEYNTKTSINLRGRNTGLKAIDLYCFLEYESDILLQLHTGKVEQA